MAVIDIELPVLILVTSLPCAILAWLLGTVTQYFRDCRYRVAFGIIAFPLSGLMGFFSTIKLESSIAGGWIVSQPTSVLVGIGYLGYLIFGFLGCWTAVRIAGRSDRQHTLSTLYTLLQARQKRDLP